MFNNYGVVKEVFIAPAKRSRASIGNKLGVVRYECYVSADIAILRTWAEKVGNNSLLVKVASFGQEEKYNRERNTMNQVKVCQIIFILDNTGVRTNIRTPPTWLWVGGHLKPEQSSIWTGPKELIALERF